MDDQFSHSIYAVAHLCCCAWMPLEGGRKIEKTFAILLRKINRNKRMADRE